MHTHPYGEITVSFSNISEIRMGSPFNVCQVILQGEWVPSFEIRSWQDIYARTNDGRFLALVAWEITKNNPGFRIVIIDMNQKTVRESARIEGCCQSLEWIDADVRWKAFPGSEGSISTND